MAINFTNTGFLNFNEKYNRFEKNKFMTAAMTVSNKQKDGTYENGLKTVFISSRCLADAQEAIKNRQLVDIEGFATVGQKSYLDMIITSIKPHYNDKQDNQEDAEIDLPF